MAHKASLVASTGINMERGAVDGAVYSKAMPFAAPHAASSETTLSVAAIPIASGQHMVHTQSFGSCHQMLSVAHVSPTLLHETMHASLLPVIESQSRGAAASLQPKLCSVQQMPQDDELDLYALQVKDTGTRSECRRIT